MYAAYIRERELQATAVRLATEMYEKIDLGITAPEGMREYTKQRKTRILYRSIRRVRRCYNPDPRSIRRRYARIAEMQRGIRA